MIRDDDEGEIRLESEEAEDVAILRNALVEVIVILQTMVKVKTLEGK